MRRVRGAGVFASILVLTLLACGKRGDPLPPLRRTPASVLGLRVAQRGDQLEVSYQAPGASIDGVRLADLRMELLIAQGDGDFEKLAARRSRKAEPGERVSELIPAPPAGTTVRVAVRALARGRASVRTPVAGLVAQTPLVAPHGLTAELVATGVALAWKGARPEPLKAALPTPAPLAGPPGSPGTHSTLPGAGPVSAQGSTPTQGTAGATRTPPVAPGAAPTAPSAPSGPPPAAPATAPVVPTPASGTARPAGTAPGPTASPEGAPPAAPPFPGGFSVYRRAKDGVYGLPLATLADAAFADTSVPLGQSFCYVVRAVASLEPLVESAGSEEACVAVADISPPATPAGLSILASAEGIELTWSPSPEADLAGYRILRANPAGAPEALAEVAPKETQYLDKSAVRGVRYRYRIVAFDHAGNASAPSEPAEGEMR